MIRSGSNSCITLAPFITVSTDGSGSIPSISFVSIPASFKYSTTLSTNPKRFMDPPPRHNTALFPLIVFSVSNAFSPKYKSLGNVNLAITNISFTWMTEIEPFLIYPTFEYPISIDCFATNTLYIIVKILSILFLQLFAIYTFDTFIIHTYKQKKEPCTITRSFSLSYIFIYVRGLLNIPLIHVFSTYMLDILRIHHPSLHYNMSEFHFLQYQRRLIYQPSPMSVSCQSTSMA